MRKTKTILTGLISLLLISTLLLAGCQQTPANQEIPPDPFTSTWDMGKEGKMFSISGNSAGHKPGEQSEFLLKINNHSGDGTWQGEYCILLVNQEVIKEITHENSIFRRALRRKNRLSLSSRKISKDHLVCVLLSHSGQPWLPRYGSAPGAQAMPVPGPPSRPVHPI